MCIYGMEGPGGYQFVGRTIQMWNRYKETDSFKPGKPWLLRFFDQIRFYPVTTEELARLREDFPEGRFSPKIEESEFSLKAYLDFLDTNSVSIETFRKSQRKAFNEERQRWEEAGVAVFEEDANLVEENETALPENAIAVDSPVSGSLWKSLILDEGTPVVEGETVAIVESMKMEVPIDAPCSGIVSRILVKEGQSVTAGQVLYGINPD